jgi:arylsulfatase A
MRGRSRWRWPERVLGYLLAGLIGGLFAVAPAGAAEGPAKRVNIVFLLIDDFGWADTSCYGRKEWKTPQIDRLAAEGCRFTDAYAAAPICSASRAAILTGKHPARLHVTDWIPGFAYPQQSPLVSPKWSRKLADKEMTLADNLGEAGYVTAMIGKWHVGGHPARHGFQNVIQLSSHNECDRFQGPERRFMTDRKGDAALSFLEQNRDKPFFLYFATNAVHVPIAAAPEKIAKHAAAPNPTYAGMVEHVDDNVGRILDKIRELGIDDRTIVIFFSDNGGVTTFESYKLPPVTSNAPQRANKGTVYEGGIRVPMIVKWPGVTRPGSTCSVPVIGTDFYPTLLEMAVLPLRPQQHLDGLSLVPVLKGGAIDRDALYWHYPHYSQHAEGRPAGAVRQGPWKLVELFESGKLELYNLRDDIGERVNLADKEPARAAQLLDRLRSWRQQVGAQMPSLKGASDVSLAEPRSLYDEDDPGIRVEGRAEDIFRQLMREE